MESFVTTEGSMENLTLFIIFGVIGVICIFNLTVGKKNRQKAAQHNKDVFGALRDKAVDTFGQAKFDKMKKVFFADGKFQAAEQSVFTMLRKLI